MHVVDSKVKSGPFQELGVPVAQWLNNCCFGNVLIKNINSLLNASGYQGHDFNKCFDSQGCQQLVIRGSNFISSAYLTAHWIMCQIANPVLTIDSLFDRIRQKC